MKIYTKTGDAGDTGPRLAQVTTVTARSLAAMLAGGVLALACGTLETGNDRVNPERPLWFHRPGGAIRVLFTRPLTIDSRGSDVLLASLDEMPDLIDVPGLIRPGLLLTRPGI